jgi:hypothetical protein
VVAINHFQSTKGKEKVMNTIEVDDQVFDQIKAHAEPFVDTPNSVLRRLLGIDGAAPAGSSPAGGASGPMASGPKLGRRASPGSILPEREYELPILEELIARGGTGHATEITDAVGERMADRLTALDREKLDSGDIRWRNRVQFTRLTLKNQELIASDTPRGVWTITDKGRAFVKDARPGD